MQQEPPKLNLLELLSVGIWITSLVVAFMIEVAIVLNLPKPIAVVLLVIWWVLRLWPLYEKRPAWIAKFVQLATRTSNGYFPITVVVEDQAAFKAEDTYLVGMEPHSVMPVAIPSVFNDDSAVVPEGLKPIHGLATSVIFWTPIVKHLWWWLGIRPAEKNVMKKYLNNGVSLCIVPGGVRELLYMDRGKEALYLSTRGGFVKLALQTGANLVPSFAFRQTELFSYIKLDYFIGKNLYEKLARAIRFCPLILWGRWGIPGFPKQVPMTVVVGKPIHVTKTENPSDEMVQEYLNKFISEMERIFNQYKKQAGCEDLLLEIH
eukprot:TRINITY_DN8620_c0_g2_i2.p1 TRINITY_DN8620_c0_g2~~TRINITY_DN8620_c0_g2_i2.p1  ORF type:complete len:353 (-),score=32.87 TRINITY_DN8620_c0_g2_i2:382-1338(-)